MSPRQRNELNKHNIKNLYIKRDNRSATGFSCQYRDPRFGDPRFPEATKRYHSLGSDVANAKEEATTLNAVLYGQIASAKVNNILVSPSNSCTGTQLTQWIDQYLSYWGEKLKAGNVKPNTLRVKKNIAESIRKAHGKLFFSDITVSHIDKLLTSYVVQEKGRMAQSVRSVYIDIYKIAIGKGIDGITENIADRTINPTSKVKRERLMLEHFNVVMDSYTYDPYRFSALLALVTGQRRTDLCLMRKSKGKDWDERFIAYRKNPNHFMSDEKVNFAALAEHAPYSFVEGNELCVFQLKTGNLLKIPLSLRIDAIGLSVGDVIDQANLFAFSPFILHHNRAFGLNKRGTALHPGTVSKQFKVAIDNSGLSFAIRQPTFHEIRSLSERLYRDQGVNTKKLLGHKREAMTDVYNDVRGCDWSKVGGI